MEKIIRGTLECRGFDNHLYGFTLDGRMEHLGVLGPDYDMEYNEETEEWEERYWDPNDDWDLSEAYGFELVDIRTPIPNPIIYGTIVNDLVGYHVGIRRLNTWEWYTAFHGDLFKQNRLARRLKKHINPETVQHHPMQTVSVELLVKCQEAV